MQKEIVLRIVAFFLALLGLLVLWQSTVWGMRAAPGIILQLGSVSGDIQHQIVYEGAVTAFRSAGAFFFGIGLWRVIEPNRKDRMGF